MDFYIFKNQSDIVPKFVRVIIFNVESVENEIKLYKEFLVSFLMLVTIKIVRLMKLVFKNWKFFLLFFLIIKGFHEINSEFDHVFS